MPKTKGTKSKKKKNVSAVARIVKITIGSAVAVGFFFGSGYLVEYFLAKEETKIGLRIRFLPSADEEASQTPAPQNTPRPEKSPTQSELSFFKTLTQKEEKDSRLDTIRQKALLAVQKAKKTAQKALQDDSTDQGHKTPQRDSRDVIYKIQLGSFTKADRAETFCAGLRQKGFDPYITKVSDPVKGTMYRVRIGRFASLPEAKNVATEIEKTEKISTFITSR